MTEARAHQRYRRLIRLLLPGELQLDAEAEMVETFAAAHARVAGKNAGARALFWIGAVIDLLAAAISERASRQGGWLIDVRHVLRGLASSRAYAAVAVLSLAIGIGANSAVFSVIRVLLIDPVAVRNPEQLALVYWHQHGDFNASNMNSGGYKEPGSGLQLRSNYSFPMYQSVRAAAADGAAVAGFNFIRDVSVQYGDQPAVSCGGLLADGGFFSVVAPRMALGRGLAPGDDLEGAEPAAVLSHRFWMRAFGGDRNLVGRIVRINSIPTRVVGVTAPEFRGLSKGGFFPETDVTIPLRLAPLFYPRWNPQQGSLLASERHFWVRLIARVPEGASRETIAAQLSRPITPHLAPMLKGDEGRQATVWMVDGARGVDQTRPETRKLLFMLMGVVGAVLVIACINLAGLMLARGIARRREMAVRRALGAGRGRLVRIVVLEALILAVAGGIGGLVLTWWSRAALTTLLTAGIGSAPVSTQPLEVAVDFRLVIATFALSLIAALVFSLIPAWRLSGDDASGDLRQQVVGARSPKLIAGRLLVALQIAVTMPLVVGAALFLRTMAHLDRVELGFDPRGVAYFKVDPSVAGIPSAAHAPTYVALLERLRAVPGVSSATLMENALMSGYTSNNTAVVDGRSSSLFMNAVGPDFLGTMGMRLLAGRAPGVQDGPGAPAVGALNETAARMLFGAASPLGRTIEMGSRRVEIVGVVSDSRYDRQRAAVRPTLYDSALQRAGYGGHHVVIRSDMPLAELDPHLRRAVGAVHRDLPIPAVKTQVAHMEEATIRERVFTQMLSLFGIFTLLLASIGLYGVTAYAVRRRSSEIGLRMALGAQRRDVVWMIERQVVGLALLGLAAGVPIALAVAPLVESLLFGVAPRDAVMIAAAAAALLIAAAAAGFVPARRAASIDPLRSLKAE